MPRYNVLHEGKWIVFSSVVDDFVSPFMTKDEFIKWRMREYRLSEKESREDLENQRFNMMTLEESLSDIGFRHGIEKVREFAEWYKLDQSLLDRVIDE